MHRWAAIRSLALVLFVTCFANHPVTAQTMLPSPPPASPLPQEGQTLDSPASDFYRSAVRTSTFDRSTFHTSGEEPTRADDPRSRLAALVQQADLILRGRVLSVQSRWAAEQRLIESVVTVRVAYALLGDVGATVTLRTPGGYLAAEGLGMVSMHAASFTPGEDVLLFLAQQGKHWQMVDGAGGKFLAQGEQMINPDWVQALPTDQLLRDVLTWAAAKGSVSPFSTLWLHRESHSGVSHPLSAPIVSQRGYQPQPGNRTAVEKHKWPTPDATATYYVNINTQQVRDGKPGRVSGVSSEELRRAIVAAADAWSGVQSADFTLRYGGPTDATATGYNGTNEILFMAKGHDSRAAAAEVWYRADGTIVEADIWINDDYLWNTTGDPTPQELDLQSALQHEFGHWLILGHFAEQASVMYPRLAKGSVKRTLQVEDIAGISTIYPR